MLMVMDRTWLFASSLVLGVGLLGGFGRILEKEVRQSIRTLEHFAKNDTHATQYALIGQSLLSTALEYLERREMQDRMRRSENSSQLFGLVRERQESKEGEKEGESDAFLEWMQDGRFWDEGGLNLFPLLDGGGGIDLAHYF